MPARPRVSNRGPLKRIPSTIRRMEKNSKRTSSPTRLVSRIRSNPTIRRTRSPKSRKTFMRSPPKRRQSQSPKRNPDRKAKEVRIPSKRIRDSFKRRSKSPRQGPSSVPARSSPPPGDRRLYAERDDSLKIRNVLLEKGSELPKNREDLKSIKMRINRDIPGSSGEINRRLVHPETVTIVRRPAREYSRGMRNHVELDLDDARLTSWTTSEVMPVRHLRYSGGRGREDRGEGSTPIFDRQEIIENRRKYDEEDNTSFASHSDRLHYEAASNYNDGYRQHDYYSDKERDRNVSRCRSSPRTYDYKVHDSSHQLDDQRYRQSARDRRSRSFDRLRDYTPERKERYEERIIHRGARRSLDRDRERERNRARERERDRDRERDRERNRSRGRSDERLTKRASSSGDSKRRMDSYRDNYEDRKARSLERRNVDCQSPYRGHHEYASGDRYSGGNHSSKNHGYFEHAEDRENGSSSSSRGRGGGFYSRTSRGGSVGPGLGRPMIRNAGFIVRPIAPIGVIRGGPVPRLAVPGRRMPFPPRLLPPVIQFFAPVRPRGIRLL